MTDEEIDKHLDAVLRASGSALRHFSFQTTKKAMRDALRNAMDDAIADACGFERVPPLEVDR